MTAIFTGVGYLLSCSLGVDEPHQSFDQSVAGVWQPDEISPVSATTASIDLWDRIVKILRSPLFCIGSGSSGSAIVDHRFASVPVAVPTLRP
jgi:hypothetical protein